MSEVASGLARRAYWLCAKRGCNAWNWCDKRWTCKACGTSAPPWTKEYRSDKPPPRVDADGFVQQPRGRAEQRAARRSASQRALSGSTAPSSAPNSRARRARPWGEAKTQIEELQAQLAAARERVDTLQGASALGLSVDFQREAESALQQGKDQVAALERSVQEAQRTERPPHSVLHIEANAIQKVERQLASARTKKEKLQLQASELRELIAEKQEQLSAAELGVDEVTGQIAELEETRAKVTQQAIQRANAAVGGAPSPLGDAVQGLLTQVGALSDLLKQHGADLPPRFSEIVEILNTQKEAVADVLRPRSSSARKRWGDSVGDDGLATEDDDMPIDIVASGPTAAGPPATRARPADGPYGPAAARGQHGATLGAWPQVEPCLAKALAEQGAALSDGDPLAAVIGKAQLVGRAGGQQLRAGLVMFGCNGNAWSRSIEALEAFFKAYDYWPDVVALQETRLPHERLPSAAAQATSGGVAILVRDGLQADESAYPLPSALRHRLIGVEVAAASGLRVLVLAGYFQHSVGPRGTNLDLFSAISEVTGSSADIPWVLQADFNMEPEPLEELGWPAAVRGHVLGPSEATCHAEGCDHLYDWFVASAALAACTASCATTLEGFGLHPHRPVLLRLQDVRADALVEVPSRPARFPEVAPELLRAHEDAEVVCYSVGKKGQVTPRSVAWSWDTGTSPTNLSVAFSEWAAAAEGTLVGIHGIVQADLARHLGRGEGPRLTLKPLSALVRRDARSRFSLLTHRLRSCLDVALQRLRAERTGRWHPRHADWYGHQAGLRAQLLLEAVQEAADSVGGALPGAAPDRLGDLVFQAGVHGSPDAVRDLQGLLGASQRRDAAQSAQAWRNWAQTAVEKGGRLAHRFSKATPPPTVRDADSGRRLVGMAAIGELTSVWQKLWLQDGFALGAGASSWDVGEWRLPPISLEQLQAACKRYSPSVGLGCDSLHPRQILLLPVALQQRILDILAAYDDAPASISGQVSLMVFIPKADGGVRLIALLPLVLRLWSRLRQPRCARWEANQQFEAASLFLDISKFYEHVRHDVLWANAVRFGFNLRLLRGLLTSYQAPRMILAAGMASPAFGTTGTVLAGCACATAVAKLPVLGALLAAGATCPLVTPRNVVDDISLQAVGTARLVKRQMLVSSCEVVRLLREQHLPLNESKSVFLASSPQLAKELSEEWAAQGLAFKRGLQARNLGTDANITRRGVHEGAGRAVGGLRRGRRLGVLRSAGAATEMVHRAGPTAAMLWGRTVTGVPDRELHSWRLAAVRSAGKFPKGAPLGLRLRAVEVMRSIDLDPSPALLRAAVQMAASLLQSGEVSQRMFEAAVQEAERRHAGAAAPWAHCRTPVDALALSLTRVGWRLVQGTCLATDDGHILDLRMMGPRELGLLAAAGARRASDRSELARLGHGALPPLPLFWEAFSEVLGPGSKLSHREKAAVVSFLSNAHWPQTRLHSAGEREHARCCACDAPRGSLWHRLFECPVLAGPRSDAMAVMWRNRPADGLLGGRLYLDGSALDPEHASLRRAGWSIVQCDSDGNMECAVYGSVRQDLCPFQSAKDGEDFAVWMLSRFLGPCVDEILIDCASTVSCLTLGKRYATAANKPNAHLWEGIYASLDVDMLKVTKVAAHCTARDVMDGKITEADLRGNGHADRWAKAGAELHRSSPVARREFFGTMEVVRELSCWVAQASLIWQGIEVKDCEGLPEGSERTAVSFAAPVVEPASSRPSDSGSGDGWASAARAGGVSLGATAFVVAGHVLAFARCGEGAAEQELIACTHCGAYARLGGRSGAAPKLKEQCPGSAGLPKGRRDQKARWLQGRHPAGTPHSGSKRVGAAVPSLRKEDVVPMDARVRFLQWLGVRPEDGAPGGDAASASRGPPSGAAAAGEAAGEPLVPGPAGASREAWLSAYGLDEASLLEWSAAAETAREDRRKRRRLADDDEGS
ncbi:unnamed protein product [Prorocentrum cordatum]|uniref:RNase H type-1 domain-containing protein n=1 Tax=Prorocentrum cordatum TaxID=2364126 RepID=A0ABN9U368_9DINO|nr:unnamed protein product [Polarella glacialis]